MSGIIGVSSNMRSGIVGRADHIANIITSEYNGVQVSYTSSASNLEVLSTTITLTKSTNKVLVMCSYGVYMDGSVRSQVRTKIRRTPSGGSSVDINRRYHYREADGELKQVSSGITCLDTPAPSGTLTITYKLVVDGITADGSVGYIGTTAAGASVTLTLLEIQVN